MTEKKQKLLYSVKEIFSDDGFLKEKNTEFYNIPHYQRGYKWNSNNVIKIYASWNYNDFKNYMRGINRIPQNNIMPNYTNSELSDLDIEKMYEILKDGR